MGCGNYVGELLLIFFCILVVAGAGTNLVLLYNIKHQISLNDRLTVVGIVTCTFSIIVLAGSVIVWGAKYRRTNMFEEWTEEPLESID